MDKIIPMCVGLIVMGVGLVLVILGYPVCGTISILGGAAMALGYQHIVGRLPGGAVIEVIRQQPKVEAKQLDPQVKQELQSYVRHRVVPGQGAPAFSVLGGMLPTQVLPTSDPLVPMYRLDDQFRIIDWNDAFSLAFDRTMEGRCGESVLEWVYFLDNYQEVVDRGLQRFSSKDPSQWPLIDVEELRYSSNRYGPICATKRAYRICNDDGSYRGWVAILGLTFENDSEELQYLEDLMQLLTVNQMWSEYAMSYDQVLANTNIYWDLVRETLGEGGAQGALESIPHGSRILDLGAGTGNVSQWLASQNKNYIIYAMDNNSAMLSILRAKCKQYLREDDLEPGVIAVQQDVTSLFGLKDNDFQYALLINVLYSVADPVECLREVHRVLRPGGEVRITGPKKNTNLSRLFRQIKRDLKRNDLLDRIGDHCERVERINKYRLSSMLYKWNTQDVQDLLREAGFADLGWSTDNAYAGQGMIVTARK